jgi:hypothetical protein
MAAAVPGLRSVARGSALVFPGVALLMLLAHTLWLMHGFLKAAPFGKESYLALPAAGLVLLQMVGQALCLGGPREAGGRGLLAAALVLNAVAAGLAPAALLDEAPAWFDLLVLLASGAAQVPFLIFLRRVARSAAFGDLEERAERAAFCWAVLVLLPAVAVIVLQAGGLVPADAWLVAVIAGVVLVALALALILYGNLVIDLVHAARRHGEAAAEQDKLREAGWIDPRP